MVNSTDSPGSVSPDHPGQGNPPPGEFEPPPSLPLQVFLLCAFLVTVAAYVVGRPWSEATPRETALQRKDEGLKRKVQNQNRYFAFAKLGFQAEEQKHFDVAVSNFQNALLMENSGEAHCNLGDALLLESRPALAVTQFQTAARLDPKLKQAYTGWGEALADQGKLDDAIATYRQALQHNPEFPLLHFKLAAALESRKKTTEALDEYNRAAALGLDTPDFFLQFGAFLNDSRQFARAESYLTKALAANSPPAIAQFQLAWAQQQQGNDAGAISHYEAVLAQTPDHPDALNNLAEIYARATNAAVRSPKMAVLLATRACAATGEKNPRFLDTLARAYAADGDFTQAVVWENKAVERAKELSDPALLTELSRRCGLLQQHKLD